MGLKRELQRISKMINDMPVREFEEMLFDCGLGIIRPSEQSDFIKCFGHELFNENMGDYVLTNQVFLPDDYKDFYDFNDVGQEVA